MTVLCPSQHCHGQVLNRYVGMSPGNQAKHIAGPTTGLHHTFTGPLRENISGMTLSVGAPPLFEAMLISENISNYFSNKPKWAVGQFSFDMSEMSRPMCKIHPDHSNTSTVTESLKSSSFQFSNWSPRQLHIIMLTYYYATLFWNRLFFLGCRTPSPKYGRP